MSCNYCQSHDRFWIFYPSDSGGTPRVKTCGEHLVMGVDEMTFATGVVEVLVIVNQPS